MAYNFLGDDVLKKYYQYLGLAMIMAFSFYYTEKVASIVLNKNPLMQEIKKEKKSYEIESVNAIIDGEYIIPGLNGIEVNETETYYNMQSEATFNKYFLVYDQVKPEISLENNKDKIITKGNSKLHKVSLILESNGVIKDYFVSNKIKASILVDKATYQKKGFLEAINNDKDNFKSLENSLNETRENKNICVLNADIKDKCLKYHNYLVEPELVLKESNLIDIKKNIGNGSIILISNRAKLSDVKLLLKEINYKDLEMVFLSEIITEENKEG